MAAIRAVPLPQADLATADNGGLDLTVLAPTLALVAVGVAMVFSASIPMAALRQSQDIYYYLKRELFFAGLGLAAMYAVSRVSMESIRKNAGVLLAITLFLLGLVLLVGVRVNGAASWLAIPRTGFRFQPSEMAKIVLVIVAARYFAGFPQGLPKWRRALPPFIVLGAAAGLIAIEPDMGTAAVVVLAMFVYFHIAGAKLRHLCAAGSLALSLAGLMIWRHPYQVQRILSFVSRSEVSSEGGYHTTQSLIAMGSGGLTGRGYCGSVEKYFYLPNAINDSILAVMGEELGFVAILGVLLLFAYLVWRGMRIAATAPDRFSGLVAAGVTCLLATQALLNIAVMTDCLPVTGVPLPFVSYGGSSLVCSLIVAGLLLNVSRGRAMGGLSRRPHD